ncbi:hypothetical protein EDC04DRAFT_2892430 [Pisolithus marmoratus]|nr:hypothetical protein EDC04DRAFT_2892430 [Pisolithus marmoratus]
MVGDSTGMFGDSPAMFGDSPGMFGDCPVMFGDSPALFGDSPAMFGDSPALLATPLDFTSERLHHAREQIIANGSDHDTAADQLALIWTLNNDLEKQEWDHWIQQQQLAAAKCERHEEEE